MSINQKFGLGDKVKYARDKEDSVWTVVGARLHRNAVEYTIAEEDEVHSFINERGEIPEGNLTLVPQYDPDVEPVTKRVLPIGTPTRTGRIYTQVVAESIVTEVNSSNAMFATLDSSFDMRVELERVAARIFNARIEDGYLVVDYKVLNTAFGVILKTLTESNVELYLAPVGTGQISDDFVVSEYHLGHFNFLSGKDIYNS